MDKRNSKALEADIREGEGLVAWVTDPTRAHVMLDADRAALADLLFVGVYPAGIVYADKSVEKAGDYKRVAFLPYKTLVLEVDDRKSPLLKLAQSHAAGIAARRGELFVLSTSGEEDARRGLATGQVVVLGG